MLRLHNSRRLLRKLFSPLDPVMVAILILISMISLVTMYSASTDRPDRFAQHIRNLVL